MRSIIRGAANYGLGRNVVGLRDELALRLHLGYWHERALVRMGLRRAEDPVRALDIAYAGKVAGSDTTAKCHT